ncbi:MAG: cell division protein FtsQ/DivIB [Solirubrobacterales bacterium]
MTAARVWRRRLIAIAALAAIVFAGYMLWLRNASWFSVDEVRVDGVTANRDQVTGALAQAAAGMTTLHIRDDELREAVSGFPTIASIKAEASFPHELHITVTERPPVAVGEVGGERMPVSADGYLLAGVEFDPKQLPSLDAGGAEGPRLGEEGAAQATILGAAPDPLAERLEAASWDESRGGVVVDLDGAPELRFGDGSAAESKWRAAAAVLVDPELTAFSYLDVSVPERPVSGG